MGDDRSVRPGRDIRNSIVQTGDNAQARLVTVTLPAPESVDIGREIEAIRQALAGLEGEHRRRIDNALAEAAEEAGKPAPDRDEVGKALERALDYAKKTGDLAEQAERLAPHITNASAWLGRNWHRLLAFVGVAA
jgi:hypothetical protein